MENMLIFIYEARLTGTRFRVSIPKPDSDRLRGAAVWAVWEMFILILQTGYLQILRTEVD